MIDPAQSFSQALGQGLGIMKSYRDEARLDEERAFDRQIKLRAEARLDAGIKMAEETARQQRVAFDFDYAPNKDGVSRKEQNFNLGIGLTEQQLRGATAEADQAVFNADPERMEEMYGLGVEGRKADIAQSRASAASSYASAEYSRAGAARQREETRLLRNEAAERERRNANMGALQAIISGNADVIRGNPAVAPLVGRMAAQIFRLPSLLEALQNPNGDWVNDPRKVGEVFSFSNVSIKRTAERNGISPDSAQISRPRTSTRTVGGQNIPVVEFEVRGKDARTGQTRSVTSYVKTDRLLDAGYVAAKSYRELSARPDARARLVGAVRESDRELANDIVADRVAQLEAYLKGRRDTDRSPAVSSARIELARLTGSNLAGVRTGTREYEELLRTNSQTAADVIFNGLGRAYR